MHEQCISGRGKATSGFTYRFSRCRYNDVTWASKRGASPLNRLLDLCHRAGGEFSRSAVPDPPHRTRPVYTNPTSRTPVPSLPIIHEFARLRRRTLTTRQCRTEFGASSTTICGTDFRNHDG